MKVYAVQTDKDFSLVDEKIYTSKERAEAVAKEHNRHWSAFYYNVVELDLESDE